MNTDTKSYRLWFTTLIIALLFATFLNIGSGSVSIPFSATLKALFGGEIGTISWKYIILNYRLPKAITAILVGGGLAGPGHRHAGVAVHPGRLLCES